MVRTTSVRSRLRLRFGGRENVRDLSYPVYNLISASDYPPYVQVLMYLS